MGTVNRFKDKTVLITGAGSGIGRVMSERFAAEGAHVFAADLDEASANATAEAIGHGALGSSCDVSVPEDVASTVKACVSAFGGVDVLINNAAYYIGEDIENIEPDIWDRNIDVDLKGPYLCSRECIPVMRASGGGSIVNIGSVNGMSGLGLEAYSAAKAALINLTKNMAVRYGPDNIRTNLVAPGSIRTPAWDARREVDPDVFQKLLEWYPLGRIGEPEDVAKAVMFLASDDASWITGSVLRVDGGFLAGDKRAIDFITSLEK